MKKEIPEQKSTEIKKVIVHRIKDFATLYRSGPDLYFYKRVMQMNGQSQDLDEFIDNEYNLELLYATLVAWDMNSRGAKLKYFDDFKDSILSNRHHLKMLWKMKLEEIEDIEAIIEVLGTIYDNLHLMKGQGRLVSNSKLLHFICPALLMPMDSSIWGKPSWISARRITTESILPPKYPVTKPSVVPMVPATSTAEAPYRRETRPPYRIRLTTSRPRPSVPKMCPGGPPNHSGGSSLSPTSIAKGSGTESTGARIVAMHITSTIRPPSTIILFLSARVRKLGGCLGTAGVFAVCVFIDSTTTAHRHCDLDQSNRIRGSSHA